MAGRGLAIPWQEEEAELLQLYRQEKDRHRRRRLQAFWLLRQGHSLRQVQQVHGVSYRTLERWVASYREGGLGVVLERTPGHGAKGKPSRLNPKQKQAFWAKASQGEFHTAQDARLWLEAQWGVEYSLKGIYSLFQRLAITNKLPRPQAEKADPEAQEAWKRGA